MGSTLYFIQDLQSVGSKPYGESENLRPRLRQKFHMKDAEQCDEGSCKRLFRFLIATVDTNHLSAIETHEIEYRTLI